MSLLSDTRYTPQRIYSLLRLLEANDGRLEFDEILAWMKPKARGFDLRVSDDAADDGGDEDHNNIRQLIGAATSLDHIERVGANQYRLKLTPPPSLEAYADHVHDQLVATDEDHIDAVVLEAYAAVVALTDLEGGVGWLDVVGKDRAARINGAVRPPPPKKDGAPGDNRFNFTKHAPWMRWMIFLGLGFPLSRGVFYPYPAQRLERELRHHVDAGGAATMEGGDLLGLVARRMPYLDGGRMFSASATLVRLPPQERTVSRVLSGALRDLHDDGRLALDSVGDAHQMYALAQEPHLIRAFKMVDVKEPARG